MNRFFRAGLLNGSTCVLAAVLFGGTVLAQAQPTPQPVPPNPNQPAQPGQPGTGTIDRKAAMEAFMRQRQDKLKTLLGATDDEFAVLYPLIEKVKQIQLSNDPRLLSMRIDFKGMADAMHGAQGGDPKKADPKNKPPEIPKSMSTPFGNIVETDAGTKTEELYALLQNKESSNTVLKAKLDELRTVKKLAKDELTRAQIELRSLCTVRQESVLVMMGVLE